MWPNPGPIPPFGETNPAFPPGYNPLYPTNPAAFPGFPANPAYTPNIPFAGPSTHTGGYYPQPPNPGYLPGQYPAVMNPALPYGPPGMTPYKVPKQHRYPHGPHGCPPVPPPGVYPQGSPYSPNWGHHNGYYHKGVKPSGIVAAGLTSMVMGAVTHKANKKMRKKMKKAHKWHKHGFSSSSSSSDSD